MWYGVGCASVQAVNLPSAGEPTNPQTGVVREKGVEHARGRHPLPSPQHHESVVHQTVASPHAPRLGSFTIDPFRVL